MALRETLRETLGLRVAIKNAIRKDPVGELESFGNCVFCVFYSKEKVSPEIFSCVFFFCDYARHSNLLLNTNDLQLL